MVLKMNSTYSPHPLKPYKDLIISTALTGNIPSKLKYPLLPVVPEEISEDAINCMAEGCSVVHIHARDANGMPSHSKALYEDIFGLIRAQSLDIIICASTSSRISRDVNTRLSALEVNPALRPDMASITLGSCNMRETVSINDKSEIIDMLQAFEDLNVKPEFEIFDLGMVYNLLELIMDGRVFGLFQHDDLRQIYHFPIPEKKYNKAFFEKFRNENEIESEPIRHVLVG